MVCCYLLFWMQFWNLKKDKADFDVYFIRGFQTLLTMNVVTFDSYFCLKRLISRFLRSQ